MFENHCLTHNIGKVLILRQVGISNFLKYHSSAEYNEKDNRKSLTKHLKLVKHISKLFVNKLTRPSGPILGAKDEVAPTSPPTHLRQTAIRERIESISLYNYPLLLDKPIITVNPSHIKSSANISLFHRRNKSYEITTVFGTEKTSQLRRNSAKPQRILNAPCLISLGSNFGGILANKTASFQVKTTSQLYKSVFTQLLKMPERERKRFILTDVVLMD